MRCPSKRSADNVLHYSTRDVLVKPLSAILERIAVSDPQDVGTVADDREPHRPVAQAHKTNPIPSSIRDR